METIEIKDAHSVPEESADTFGKPPLPWQLRNNWAKPKRIRKPKGKNAPIDLWEDEA